MMDRIKCQFKLKSITNSIKKLTSSMPVLARLFQLPPMVHLMASMAFPPSRTISCTQYSTMCSGARQITTASFFRHSGTHQPMKIFRSPPRRSVGMASSCSGHQGWSKLIRPALFAGPIRHGRTSSRRASVSTPTVEEGKAENMEEPKPVFRKDYAPTPFSISDIYLSFDLNDGLTRISSKLTVEPNYSGEEVPAMELDGTPDVKLTGIKVSGEEWSQDKYSLTPKTLTLTGLPKGSFELELNVEIVPENNTKLEGLYKSSGNYCSQCEAQGFRNIIYAYDRPDVMSKYTVRIEGDKEKLPVMLSNGNLKEQGDLQNGRHYTIWEDPFLKPSYLFALVAGNLSVHKDSFTTVSGKVVDLRIYAQDHNIKKVPFAMESLKEAMKWDEQRFGLEYDLDLFNIVAVDDFNMGAMENKSLNVFNTRCVLASQETATDGDFLSVQGIVAHEYFHNWTGNRVTCRDWFQLTLKEGLTVFRDQEFSSDLNSQPVKRISDVNFVRSAQFTEDAGPMAHPIRPDSYLKMDNFYTGTVYRKGAEIIRLYKTVLGVDGFRKGMDLYFERHDGQAVTCDDFLAAMADANSKDLSGLQKWYSQAGTPLLTISLAYNEDEQTLALNAKQTTPATSGQPEKNPVLIPIAIGLLGADGNDMPIHVKGGAIVMGSTAVLEFDSEEATFVFEKVAEKPVASILRGFSAPVRTVIEDQTDEELLFLFANDSDPFNRWDAGQKYLKKVLLGLYNAAMANPSESVEESCVKSGGIPASIVQAFRNIFLDKSIDGAFVALATSLPTQAELIQDIKNADPVVLHSVCVYVRKTLAKELEADLKMVLENNTSPPGEPFDVQASSVSKRAIKNKTLSFLSALNKQEYNEECLKRFREATNMTDGVSALACIVNNDCSEREIGLVEFAEKWKEDNLVMLKWMSLQAMSNLPGNLPAVLKLIEHPSFSLTNPNCNYTLCGGFAASAINFHNIDGSGYRFFADHLLKLDPITPIAASRLVNIFSKWRLYDTTRQSLIKGELERMLATGTLSENTFEIVSKSLE